MDEEQLILVPMLMPMELTAKLHGLHLLPVELADHHRSPMLRDGGEGDLEVLDHAQADGVSVVGATAGATGRLRLPKCPPRSRGCAS